MQFEMSHNIGEQTVFVKLQKNLPNDAMGNLMNSFFYLGGEVGESCTDWKFPSYITSKVIQEVIHNSCFKCGGLMKDSTAFQNTLVSSDDFGNDAGSRGTTQSRMGDAIQIKVRKCSSCGHSHT